MVSPRLGLTRICYPSLLVAVLSLDSPAPALQAASITFNGGRGWCLPGQHCKAGDCCALGSSCNTCPYGHEVNNGDCAGKGNRDCKYGPTPAPTAPTPAPTRPPVAWPTFQGVEELEASNWAKYFTSVYGELPHSYPVKTEDLWVLHDAEIAASGVQVPAVVGKCPGANPATGTHYTKNNMYYPATMSWIWHPYPYAQVTGWVEVGHLADPFGDEHFGMWFIYSPGIGIWFNTGTSIAFQEHDDAYTYFKVTDKDKNEGLAKAAAAKGYDSLQFLAHVDHVNYPCDSSNTGDAGVKFMGMELLATKLTGTFACGAEAGAPPSIRSGWQASRACVCDNSVNFLNCQGTPALTSQATHILI